MFKKYYKMKENEVLNASELIGYKNIPTSQFTTKEGKDFRMIVKRSYIKLFIINIDDNHFPDSNLDKFVEKHNGYVFKYEYVTKDKNFWVDSEDALFNEDKEDNK